MTVEISTLGKGRLEGGESLWRHVLKFILFATRHKPHRQNPPVRTILCLLIDVDGMTLKRPDPALGSVATVKTIGGEFTLIGVSRPGPGISPPKIYA